MGSAQGPGCRSALQGLCFRGAPPAWGWEMGAGPGRWEAARRWFPASDAVGRRQVSPVSPLGAVDLTHRHSALLGLSLGVPLACGTGLPCPLPTCSVIFWAGHQVGAALCPAEPPCSPQARAPPMQVFEALLLGTVGTWAQATYWDQPPRPCLNRVPSPLPSAWEAESPAGKGVPGCPPSQSSQPSLEAATGPPQAQLQPPSPVIFPRAFPHLTCT